MSRMLRRPVRRTVLVEETPLAIDQARLPAVIRLAHDIAACGPQLRGTAPAHQMG